VLGKYILEVFPSLTEETSTLLKVIKTEKPLIHMPQTYKNIRGQIIDTVNTTLPIKVNGKIIGAVEIAKDYSKMKMLSNKLLDLQAQMNKIPIKPAETNSAQYTVDDIITHNPDVEKLKKLALHIAKTNSSVLVFGETGTGKELLVQAIHNASSRKNGPFIAQNCAALPESLLESILFGTVKGSYTGAIDRAGLFEVAHGGTLFLDELQSMPLELQVKLLRILEDGLVRRIGSAKAVKVDVRVIAAMNEDPQDCVNSNRLRADLFYRLNVFSFNIPPLRERREDIPLLTEYFIQEYNRKFQKSVKKIDTQALKAFMKYPWLGNVRELRHTVEYAMNMAEEDVIYLRHLPHQFLLNKNQSTTEDEKEDIIVPLKQAMKQTEELIIKKALAKTNGNVMQAAKILQIPRQTLQYKIKRLKI
jgi:arginine utilization regulatory protein